MTAEELIAEGRKLQRPTVLLLDEGSGNPVGKWYESEEVDGERCWLTVAVSAIPNAPANLQGYLTVYTSDDGETGRVEITKDLPPQQGINLFARTEEMLPPLNGVLQLGSSAAADAGKDITETYMRKWQEKYPIYRDDVVAALGGWHMEWPDDDEDDWMDRVNDQLLIFTIRDSEPWVEVWYEQDEFKVRQRIT